MNWRPHKALIIVPATAHKSSYTAPYTVLLVMYYAPGCFRVDQKVDQCFTYDEAIKRTREYANAPA